MQVQALNCVGCGAPLPPLAGGTAVICAYCGRGMSVEGDRVELRSGDAESNLTDALLRGEAGIRGHARRYSVTEMKTRDWRDIEHGAWPAFGSASSSFGVGWSARSIVGPPRVYPKHGDRRGSWAPRAKTSHVEWIEANFHPGLPPATAIRVFETCLPGRTFAVTAREQELGDEVLLWRGTAQKLGDGAAVLEVSLDPPRSLRVVRAYVTNNDDRWTEIDTIGIVTTAPVPGALRGKRPPSFVRRVLVGIAVAAVIVGAFAWWRSGRRTQRTKLTRPATSLEGARGSVSTPAVDSLAAEAIRWAVSDASASSQYGDSNWSAAQAAGAPNVYPAHRDDKGAWASEKPDGGEEWLTVRFETVDKTVAKTVDKTVAIVVVETFNAGAVVGIDDLTDPGGPVALWRGNTASSATSRVLRIDLPEPRSIAQLRLVLDTSRILGWNEIDAVGLVVQSSPAAL